jgi:hypothetical protein
MNAMGASFLRWSCKAEGLKTIMLPKEAIREIVVL